MLDRRRFLHNSLRGAALLAAGPVLVSLTSGEAQGVVIILKDGFILKGVRLDRELREFIEGMPIKKGFFLLDDNARRIIFSPKYILDDERGINDKDIDSNPDLVKFFNKYPRLYAEKLTSVGPISQLSAFDSKWERNCKFLANVDAKNAGTPDDARQGLVILTPQYARVDAKKWAWSVFYTPHELGAETVRQLLHNHPDLRESGKVDPVKRAKLCRFLKQAALYEAAEKELADWLRADPEAKPKVDEVRAELAAIRTEELLVELERGYQVGRHDWVRGQLGTFPTEKVDNKQLAQLGALRRKYETAEAALKEARRFLEKLPALVVAPGRRATWEAAAKTILSEATIDNAARLEKFVQYAQQAERQEKQGATPTEGPEELMARGVANWLLASTAPVKPEEGLKLWRTRQFVLEYQRTVNSAGRQKLLASYEKEGALDFDELAQLISLLPPPEPEEKIDQTRLELETKEPVGRRKSGIPFVLQLPPEYEHSRRYPVLFVLHPVGETPSAFLEKWSALATSHGFMLVAPEWGEGAFQRGYGYSADEHAAVTAVLRDLQRRFNIDSDRVFLAGSGEGGGAMAYDVGLSHPDLFAGVVAMAAAPQFFAQKYATNAKHLPFYVVAGDMQINDCRGQIHRAVETWFQCSAPALWVEYRGRGLEWFGGELPTIFDWLSRKKRCSAAPDTAEFHAMRDTDNRFYWLTVKDIANRCLGRVPQFNHNTAPASVSANIQPGNRIVLKASGFKEVTIWLGRGMVDFEKPLTLSINIDRGGFKDRKLTPNLGTLLEDFYERGDRGRLFLVKIPVTIPAG